MMLCLFFAIFAVIEAAVTDLNCTTDAKYDKSAFNCENAQSDTFCLTDFAVTDPLTVGVDNDRPNACFKDTAGTVSEDVKQGAIASCAKQCGYCCLSKEFTCQNAEYPRVNCKTVKDTQCNDVKWREILAADCPAVCGFCLDGGCVDAAVECANDKSICRNQDTQDFVRANCKRTCGFCDGSTSQCFGARSTGSTFGSCVDNANCASWMKNGFCTSTFYTDEIKRYYCPRSCGKC